MDNDNDLTRAEQRDVRGTETQEIQRSWMTALAAEAHQLGDAFLDAAAPYGAGKVVSKVTGKIRKPPASPQPPSGSDSEA